MSETHLSINVAARNNEEGQKNTFQAKLGPLSLNNSNYYSNNNNNNNNTNNQLNPFKEIFL